MAGVQLEGLLGEHVRWSLLTVAESLCLVDFLHLCGVTVLGGENEEGCIYKLVRDRDLLDVSAKVGLVPVSQWLVHLLELLGLLLGDLVVIKDVDVLL